MDQPQPESPTQRTGSGYLIGSAILVILHGFLSMLRERTATRTAAYVIGTFVGGAVLVALMGLIIYGVVRAIGKARPASTAAKIVFWILLIFLILGAANFVGRAVDPRPASAQAAFTSEQRQGLQVGADSMRHVSLGFALPHPGPTFVANHEYERAFAAQFGGKLPPDLIMWAFGDSARRQFIIIQVIGLPGLDEEKFRKVGSGIREGLAKATVLSEALVWEGTHRESRVVARHPNGMYLVSRCVPSVKPQPELVVCVQTISDELEALTTVSNGLTVTQ